MQREHRAICPLCGRMLVLVFQNDELHAIAHANPPCETYAKLDAEEFKKRYLLN